MRGLRHCVSGALALVLAGSALACSREPVRRGEVPPSSSEGGNQPTKTIGAATMLEDRTIVLDLYATTGGTHGQARVVYAPDNPKYDEVLRHIGGLDPGGHKPVPPWPDDIDDARTEAAVHSYVAQEKGWARSDYRIEIVGTDPDGNIAVTVFHDDDRKAPAPGERKSFALRIDPKTYSIVRDLALP